MDGTNLNTIYTLKQQNLHFPLPLPNLHNVVLLVRSTHKGPLSGGNQEDFVVIVQLHNFGIFLCQKHNGLALTLQTNTTCSNENEKIKSIDPYNDSNSIRIEFLFIPE